MGLTQTDNDSDPWTEECDWLNPMPDVSKIRDCRMKGGIRGWGTYWSGRMLRLIPEIKNTSNKLSS